MQAPFENVFGASPTAAHYALVAARHMHEHGTTSEQFAEIAAAAAPYIGSFNGRPSAW